MAGAVSAIAETAGGALLIVGLVSPVAASTVLGVLVVGALYRVTLAGGLWYFADGHGGIEYSVLLIGASLVILPARDGSPWTTAEGGRRTRSGVRGHWRCWASVLRWPSGWCSTGPIRWVRWATRADGPEQYRPDRSGVRVQLWPTRRRVIRQTMAGNA